MLLFNLHQLLTASGTKVFIWYTNTQTIMKVAVSGCRLFPFSLSKMVFHINLLGKTDLVGHLRNILLGPMTFFKYYTGHPAMLSLTVNIL